MKNSSFSVIHIKFTWYGLKRIALVAAVAVAAGVRLRRLAVDLSES